MPKPKPKRRGAKARVPVVKQDGTLPKYGFGKLYFIMAIANVIVQGKVESINTIHKPVYDDNNNQTGVKQDHYYTLSCDMDVPESYTIHEENLFTTQTQASIALGKRLTMLKK